MKLNYLANCIEEIIKTCEGELDIKHYRAVERAMECDYNVDKMDNDTLINLDEMLDIYLGL